MDIMILADMSGSVQFYQDFVSEATQAFINRFELSDNGVRIGLVTFSTDAVLVSEVSTNKALLINQAKGITNKEAIGYTNLSSALQIAAVELMNNRASPKMIIVITDGNPDDINKSRMIAQGLRDLNQITVCGVLVNNSIAKGNFLNELCTHGCYTETNYSALASELEKMNICL